MHNGREIPSSDFDRMRFTEQLGPSFRTSRPATARAFAMSQGGHSHPQPVHNPPS